MADLAKYTVALEAETAKYRRELERANKKLDKFNRVQTKKLNSITAGFRKFSVAGKAAFAVLAGGAVSRGVRNLTATAENLELVATRLNVSARELQAWQKIGERFGVQTNQLNLAVQRLTRRSQEAAGGFGEAKDALRELGIDAQGFNQLGLDDQIRSLARAFELNADQTNELRLAFKLFDSEGTAFLQLLKEGEAGLVKLREEMEGQIWSDAERDRLSKANQALTELGQGFTFIAGEAASAALSIGDFFSRLFPGNNDYQNAVEALRRAQLSDSVAARVAAGELSGAPSGNANVDRVVGQGSRPRPIPGINPTVTSSVLAPASEITDPSEVMTTRVDAMVEEFARGMTEMEQRQETFTTLFTDNMVMAADSGFDSILESWARTLQQMAARFLASKLFDLLGFGGSSGGFLGLGKLFGGPRADGGPVSSGRAYLVGEKGPEMFVPGASGQIIPNGGGTTINVNAPGAAPGMEQRIAAAVETAVALADRNRQDARRRGR